MSDSASLPTEQLRPALEAQAVVLLAQSSGDVFNRCVSLALHITQASTAVALLYRPSQDELEIVAAAGDRSENAAGRRLQRGWGLSWRVMNTGAAVLVSRTDLQEDAGFLAGRPLPNAYLGVPILDPDGTLLGVLSVDRATSEARFSGSDAQVLTLLGQAAGVAYTRSLALERAQRNAQRFERLAALSAELGGLSDADTIIRHAVRVLLDLSDFTTGCVVTLDTQGQIRLTVIEGDPGAARHVAAALQDRNNPRGLIGEVLRCEYTLAVEDYQGWAKRLPDAGNIRSALAAPLRAGHRVAGVVLLLNDQQRIDIPREVCALVATVSARIGQALERAESLRNLHDTREAALRILGRVLESRDGETFGHTDRVTALALQLGRDLGLDSASLQHLRWGAYLHDLGKVAVPDALLGKPGPLEPLERAELERHVKIGEGMLRDETFIPPEVREIVRSHHERWDGLGYPDGLSGEAIPLLARIFSVADVFDALISQRPYKPAWTGREARAYLREQAGQQFDPHVVRVFLDGAVNPGPD